MHEFFINKVVENRTDFEKSLLPCIHFNRIVDDSIALILACEMKGKY